MTAVFNLFRRWPVIALLGCIMLALMISIRLSASQIGGDLLDFQMTGEAAIARLNVLRETPQGIAVHTFITGRLDMAYPVAYSLFFASLTLRFGGARGPLLALPILLAAGVDFAENMTQLQALAGDTAALHAKTWLTPIKFALVGIGIVIALWLSVRAALAQG